MIIKTDSYVATIKSVTHIIYIELQVDTHKNEKKLHWGIALACQLKSIPEEYIVCQITDWYLGKERKITGDLDEKAIFRIKTWITHKGVQGNCWEENLRKTIIFLKQLAQV